MPSWRVELTPAVARQLRRTRPGELLALRGIILGLADEPRPTGARKLTDRALWRIRVRIDGQPWRVVYQLDDAARLLLVTRVAPRDEGTYRRV
jgi:mRNA interferase RelE/StbE